MPGQSTYTAAKAGLVGLSRALALEVVGDGVTVNVVAPGYIATDSQLPFEAAAAASGPIGRSGTPAEIAACVLFLAHELASFVTGTVVVADGGHGLPETWPRPLCPHAISAGFGHECGCGSGDVGTSADGGNVQVGLGGDALDSGTGTPGRLGPR